MSYSFLHFLPLLTQSQSATVYFICTIPFFLNSRSLRLCISSVRFLLTVAVATLSFFCTISSSVNTHFSDVYLKHDLTDFDPTCLKVPVDHPIYATCLDWCQGSRRGRTGVKNVIFTKNATPAA